MVRNRMRVVSVKFPEKFIDGLDQLVKMGAYMSRSDAIRIAVRDLLIKELPNPILVNRSLVVRDGEKRWGSPRP